MARPQKKQIKLPTSKIAWPDPRSPRSPEIQKPRKRNVLINYDKLMELFGASSYEQARRYHKEWINEYLDKGNGRDNKWTKSIAVGSKEFVDDVKRELGGLAKGRQARVAGESYRLRELSMHYGAILESKMEL